MHMPKVLLITGPGGSGKTTVSEMLSQRSGFEYLDGDNVDTEFFPDGDQWLPENAEKLKMAHKKILMKTRELVDQGKSAVVDYIIFGRYPEFVESFKKEFGGDFQIKVLFPSRDELVKRDRNRECWTTGIDRIDAVHKEFDSLKDEIGNEHFLDTTGQIPEETVEAILSKIS